MDLKYTDIMKPEDISIAYLWTIFAGAVLSPSASQVQRDEMRKSFYAGFVECFKIMDDLSNALPEEESLRAMDRLNNEARDFYKEIVRKADEGN